MKMNVADNLENAKCRWINTETSRKPPTSAFSSSQSARSTGSIARATNSMANRTPRMVR